MSKVNCYEMGSMRFAEAEEIRNSTTEVFLNEECKCGGVPLLSDGNHMWVDGKDTNTLCVSTPGGGKSRRICTPTLLSDIAAGNSIIVTDPKGELLKSTYYFLKKHNYNIKTINYRDPLRGNRWNPLYKGALHFKNGREDLAAEEFSEIGHCIYQQLHSEKDPFWEIAAENIFTGYALLACHHVEPENVTLGLIYRMFLDGEKRMGSERYLDQYLTDCEDETLRQALSDITTAPRETRASIASVFSSQLSKLIINKSIDYMLTGTSFSPEEFAEKKTALFICLRDESSTYSSLVSLMVHELYTGLIDYAEKNSGRLEKTVDFILDEFSNFPKILDMDNKISSCRSRNIRFFLFIQSLFQLYSVYGENVSQTLLQCCDNWICLQSRDLKILQQFSERCGDIYGEYSQEKRPLLSAAAIQHLSKKDGECLFLYGSEYPYVAELPDRSLYMEKLGIKELKKLPEVKKGAELQENVFSLMEYVKRTRDEKIKEILMKDEDMESPVSVEKLVTKIDAKIAELELEGKMAKENSGAETKNVDDKMSDSEATPA